MIAKSKIVLIAMVALLAVGTSAFVFAHSKEPNNQTAVQNQSNASISSTSNTTGANAAGPNQKLISASEAQSTAQKYIQEPGATAGNPDLKTLNGEQVYVVPVILNGKTVGEIDIDAISGNNVGGAGGAP